MRKKALLTLLMVIIGASTLTAQKLPSAARLADKQEYAERELYLNDEEAPSEEVSVTSVWLRNTQTGQVTSLLKSNPAAPARWSDMAGKKSVEVPLSEVAAADNASFVPDADDLILVEGCPDGRNIWSYVVNIEKRTAIQLPSDSGLLTFMPEEGIMLMQSYGYDMAGETGRYTILKAFRYDGTYVGELPLGPNPD